MWLGMFKGLLTNLWITDYPCFSIFSVCISAISLFFSNPTYRRMDQRRGGKMGQGILCPRQTSAPQSHTLKETGICGHSVSVQTQRWVAERQKSNSASIKL